MNIEEKGVRVYRCGLWMDDYLWFASSDISAISTTAEVIHNYALAYALNRYDRAIVSQTAPTYREDLKEMPVYVTPAFSQTVRRTSLTFNAIDTKTQQTESPHIGKRVTPKLGSRRVINPTLSSSQAFWFYAFASGNAVLPRVIRLGKKRSPAHLEAKRLECPVARFCKDEVRLDGVINPLDTEGDALRYSVVSIPPHLLLTETTMSGVWTIRDDSRNVLVPDVVLRWMGLDDDAH